MRIAIFFNFALHFEGTLTNKKMKKVLKAFIMLVCAGSMLAAVSSCEGNEETQEVFTYSASANLTTSTSGNYYDAVMFDYNDAIRGLLGEQYVSVGNRDSEVKEVCDAVYEKHMEENLNVKGTVEIRRTAASATESTSDEGSSSEVVIIAKYTYGE